MKLSATPFDATTGQLLPVYRDAYLRGDLSRDNTRAVDAYLKKHRQSGDETLTRFHDLQQLGEDVQPLGWVHRQLELIRTEPQRFRQRAAALVGGVTLVGSVVFAGSLPTGNLPTENLSETGTASLTEAAAAAEASAAFRMVTVRGRILDENGHPLVGATVLDKTTGRGVGTDAQGNYTLRLPAGQARELQYGYGGYADEQVQLNGKFTQNVTLVPRDEPTAKKKHRWLFF